MRRRGPRLQVRMLASMAVLTLLAGVLLGRLGQLQLTDHAAGEGGVGPGTSAVALPALRGRILDREGRPLVDNGVRTDVTIDRAVLADAEDGGRAMVRRLSRVLDLPFAGMWGRTTLCGAPGAADPPLCWTGSPLVPVPVAEDVDPAAAATITERPERFPGVDVVSQPVRAYPRAKGGGGAPQTTGYLARPDAETVDASDGTVPDDSLVGASGLEQEYDELLRGTPGRREVRVDGRGVAVEEISRTEPEPGRDLVTTLDLRVQQATERALVDGVREARSDGHRADTAAAVVLDLRDGGVVASASRPTYDPSVWSRGLGQKEYERLTGSAGSPLIDRVTAVAQPPASTFKAVSLPGAVRAGTDLSTPVDCTASHRIGNRTFNNFESRSFGRISWRRAITVSCDTVFYQVAEQVWRSQGGLTAGDDAGDPLIETATDLGLGSATGIDLPGEASGRIPDREWKREWWAETKDESCAEARRGPRWTKDRAKARYLAALAKENCESGYLFNPGDEVNLSIGQGDVTATVLQMAQVFGTIARDGRQVTPRVGQASLSADGAREDLDVTPPSRVDLPGESGRLLRKALRDVVEKPDGTASSAFSDFPTDEWPVAGKTGTAEVYGKQDTGWFVSYAPANRPRYAVAVVISQGGTGGSSAAPVARDIHEELAGLED